MTTQPKPDDQKENWMLVLEDDDDRLIQPQMKYWRLGRANHKSASLTDDMQCYGRNGGGRKIWRSKEETAQADVDSCFLHGISTVYRTAPLVSSNNRKQTQHSTHTGWLNVTGLGSARLHHIARWSLLCEREKEKTKSSNHFEYIYSPRPTTRTIDKFVCQTLKKNSTQQTVGHQQFESR